jgi:hypothetical protein
MSSSKRIDRRSFAAQLTLGVGGITAASLSPIGQVVTAEDKSASIKAEPETAPLEKRPGEKPPTAELPSAEVLLLAYLTRRYPSEHFDEAALAGIFRDVRGDVARGRLLGSYKLKNSDEPAFTFSAFRSSHVPQP